MSTKWESPFIRGNTLWLLDPIVGNRIYLGTLETDDFLHAMESEIRFRVERFERPVFAPLWSGLSKIGEIELDLTMSFRKEKRGKLDHWYAYKRQNGKLRKLYAGHNEDINTAKIVELAKRFAGLL